MAGVIQIENNQFILQVHVQTRSSRTRWGRLVNSAWLQLKVTSPPIEGAANQACIKFMAKEFKTAKSLVSIIKGEKSRYKIFLVKEYDAEKLKSFLSQFID